MTTIAFVGLGIVGEPMAGHLLQAGHDVIGVNRNPARVARFVERGGRGAATVAAATAEAEVIVTMVPDSPDVQGIAYGADGISAHAKPGTLHLDFSTIRPDVAGHPRGRRHGQWWAGRRGGGQAFDHGRW